MVHPQLTLLSLEREVFSPCPTDLMGKADSLEKTLMLGKSEGKRRRGWQTTRWLGSITDCMDKNLSKLQEIVEDRGAWHVTVHEVAKSGTQLKRLNNSNNYMLSTKISLQIQHHREVKDKKKEIHVT